MEPHATGGPPAVEAGPVPGGGPDRHETKQNGARLGPDDTVDGEPVLALEALDRRLCGGVEHSGRFRSTVALPGQDDLERPYVRTARPDAE
jgi:hypothetical protein